MSRGGSSACRRTPVIRAKEWPYLAAGELSEPLPELEELVTQMDKGKGEAEG